MDARGRRRAGARPRLALALDREVDPHRGDRLPQRGHPVRRRAASAWIELSGENGFVRLLAETTLALVLFLDASRIDLRVLRRELGVPVRLLGIGLPLTVLLGTLAALGVLGGITVGEALVLAVVLAPTDAALGLDVVTDRRLPTRIRQSLNIESGLNDGLCVPLLFIAVAIAESRGRWALRRQRNPDRGGGDRLRDGCGHRRRRRRRTGARVCAPASADHTRVGAGHPRSLQPRSPSESRHRSEGAASSRRSSAASSTGSSARRHAPRSGSSST